MPLERINSDGPRMPHFTSDSEEAQASYNRFQGQGVAACDRELDRLDQILDPVFNTMGEDGDLAACDTLDGQGHEEKGEHLVLLQSQYTGVLHARRQAAWRVQIRDDHEGQIRNLLMPEAPELVSEQSIQQYIDQQIDQRSQLANGPAAEGRLSLYAHIEAQAQAQANMPLLQLLQSRSEYSPILPPHGEQDPWAELTEQAVLQERFLTGILPHTTGVDGLMLGERYPQDVRLAAGNPFTTGQYDPFVPRDPGYVPSIQRPPQISDYIPSVAALSDSVSWMLEDQYANKAAPVAESTALPATLFGATEQTSQLQDIGHQIQRSLRVLRDAPESARMINVAMPNGVRESADLQFMQGAGTGNNLKGIFAYTINTSANPAGDAAKLGRADISYDNTNSKWTKDAIKDLYKAKEVSCKKHGRCIPDLVVLSHEMKAELMGIETDGGYGFMWGSPASQWMDTFSGIDIVTFDTQAAVANLLVEGLTDGGTNAKQFGLMLDTQYARQRPRMGVGLVVQAGHQDQDFSKRQMTLICYIFTTFYLTRPLAVVALMRKNV